MFPIHPRQTCPALVQHLLRTEPAVARLLATMEHRGVLFDAARAGQLLDRLRRHIDGVRSKLARLGCSCDPASSRDVARLLFRDLGVAPPASAGTSVIHLSTKVALIGGGVDSQGATFGAFWNEEKAPVACIHHIIL